jgi:hypothetical protein
VRHIGWRFYDITNVHKIQPILGKGLKKVAQKMDWQFGGIDA